MARTCSSHSLSVLGTMNEGGGGGRQQLIIISAKSGQGNNVQFRLMNSKADEEVQITKYSSTKYYSPLKGSNYLN